MSDEKAGEPEEIPEDGLQDEREPDLNVADITTSGRGMKLSRMREIEKADNAGEPLDITPEEREQYEKAKADLSKVMRSFSQKLNEPFEGISKKLQGIIAQSVQSPKVELKKTSPESYIPLSATRGAAQAVGDLLPKPVRPDVAGVSEEAMASMQAARRERDDRQAAIQDNTYDMAMAVQGMLTEMQTESGRVGRQSKKDTKRWWWVFGVAALTLVFAGIAAIPIMAPFFVDLWRYVTGG
ncbi:hypothetical protein [Arthrobacter sp. CP30]